MEVLAVAKKCKHCGHWFDEKKSIRPGYRRCPICDEIIPDDVEVCPCCDEYVGPTEKPGLALENVYDAETEKVSAEAEEKMFEVSENIPQVEPEVKPGKKITATLVGIATVIIIAFTVMLLIALLRDGNNSVREKPPYPAVTDEESAAMVAKRWNKAHQELNPDKIAALYSEQVNYYHETYTPERIYQSKLELFRKYPGFWQEISNVKSIVSDDGTAKVTFSKEVVTEIGGKSKTYPSYLLMKKVGDEWKITAESDEVTDANLARRRR